MRRHCAAAGVCVALAGLAAVPCRAADAATNTFEQTMHAVSVPEIHIRPCETPVHDPFAPSTGVACEAGAVCSNRTSFALHAKNLTAFELVDLICFLSDNTYTFGENGLSIAATNAPATSRKQDATQEKALVAKMKAIVIPEVTFRPPATIVDAVDFFYQASADYDDPEIPVKRRGINFAVKNPHRLPHRREAERKQNVPIIADAGHGSFCTLYVALTNVCDKVDARFTVRDNTVVIVPDG